MSRAPSSTIEGPAAKNDTRLLVLLPEDLKLRLFSLSRAQGVSAAELVRRSLRGVLDHPGVPTATGYVEARGVGYPAVSGSAAAVPEEQPPLNLGDPEPHEPRPMYLTHGSTHEHTPRDLGYMTICRSCGERLR